MTLPREAPVTPPEFDQGLLAFFLSLDTPPGYRAELIDQEIIVTPPQDGEHSNIGGRIIRVIMREAAAELMHNPDKGLITPLGRFIPDLIITPMDHFKTAESWASCDGVELVGEVTSSDPVADREKKRRGYAEAGVPLYLLVDRSRQVAVLFSEPEAGDYQSTVSVNFGKELHLPDPFDLTIDTGVFL